MIQSHGLCLLARACGEDGRTGLDVCVRGYMEDMEM
jgi:hypothetical protein